MMDEAGTIPPTSNEHDTAISRVITRGDALVAEHARCQPESPKSGSQRSSPGSSSAAEPVKLGLFGNRIKDLATKVNRVLPQRSKSDRQQEQHSDDLGAFSVAPVAGLADKRRPDAHHTFDLDLSGLRRKIVEALPRSGPEGGSKEKERHACDVSPARCSPAEGAPPVAVPDTPTQHDERPPPVPDKDALSVTPDANDLPSAASANEVRGQAHKTEFLSHVKRRLSAVFPAYMLSPGQGDTDERSIAAADRMSDSRGAALQSDGTSPGSSCAAMGVAAGKSEEVNTITKEDNEDGKEGEKATLSRRLSLVLLSGLKRSRSGKAAASLPSDASTGVEHEHAEEQHGCCKAVAPNSSQPIQFSPGSLLDKLTRNAHAQEHSVSRDSNARGQTAKEASEVPSAREGMAAVSNQSSAAQETAKLPRFRGKAFVERVLALQASNKEGGMAKRAGEAVIDPAEERCLHKVLTSPSTLEGFPGKESGRPTSFQLGRRPSQQEAGCRDGTGQQNKLERSKGAMAGNATDAAREEDSKEVAAAEASQAGHEPKLNDAPQLKDINKKDTVGGGTPTSVTSEAAHVAESPMVTIPAGALSDKGKQKADQREAKSE